MARRPFRRIGRAASLVLTLAVAGTTIAEARGVGGAPRGRQSGRATRRTGSQEQLLVQNAFRRDNLRRARHVDW
jgi:hypothetical protein